MMGLPGVKVPEYYEPVTDARIFYESDYPHECRDPEMVFNYICVRGESKLPLILLRKGIITPEEFLESIGDRGAHYVRS